MKRLFITLLLLLLLPAARPSGAARILDDFESGPWEADLHDCSAPCSTSFYDGPRFLQKRRALYPPPGLSMSAFALSGWGDDALTVPVPGLTRLCYQRRPSPSYPPTLWDITAGGLYRYLRLWTYSVGGFHVAVALPGGTQASVEGTTTPGGFTFVRLSDIPADLTAVDRLCVGLTSSVSTARISDVRLTRTPLLLAFEGGQTIGWCLACPPESLVISSFAIGSLPRPYDMVHSIERAEVESGTPAQLRLEGFDSGGPTGEPGEFGGTALYWDTPSAFETTAFDIVVRLHTPDGVLASMPTPPQVVGDDEGAAIEYALRFDGGAGSLGTSLGTMTFSIPTGQALRFRSFDVSPVMGVATAGPAFRVSFTLEATGDVDEAEALVSSQISGDWEDGLGPTSVPEASRDAGPSGLLAAPSVTRGPALLRLARPRAARTELTVHDAAGRVVRRLNVEAGAASVFWDGLDQRGARLPAGVYLASIRGGGEQAVTKVTILR